MRSAVAPVAALEWDGRGVSVPEVVDRLARLRRPDDDSPPMTLAGVLDLVAYTREPDELPAMRELIHGLADHQPSRAVIVAADGEGAGIDADVGVSCRRVGERASVAVECVTLVLHGPARAGAASAVVPLLRHDLPTFLWWPQAPEEVEGGLLTGLSGLCDRMICEAGRGGDAERALSALARLAAGPGPAPTDLAWAAITPWRQLLVQMLDPVSLARLRSGPSVAAVTHRGREPGLEALLIAGWLRDVLGDALLVELRGRIGAASGAGGLVAVELEGGAGRRLAVELIAERDTASVTVSEPNGGTRGRVLPLPVAGRPELLAGELELQRRDLPFERALPHALAVARA